MLRLKMQTAPAWIELAPGARVLSEPISGFLIQEAMNDPDLRALPLSTDKDTRWLYLVRSVARLAITAWEGIAEVTDDPDAPDVLAPCDREHIDALMSQWQLCRKYGETVAKGFLLLSEKKSSLSSPTGTSAEAKATAPSAESNAKSARPN